MKVTKEIVYYEVKMFNKLDAISIIWEIHIGLCLANKYTFVNMTFDELDLVNH